MALAAEGVRVVVADVDEAGLEATVAAVREAGGAALGVPTDVARLEQVEALADRAWSEFGRVHILCNNAGVVLYGGLDRATHRDWQWVLGVNLWGVIHGVEAFVPRMIAQREPGHIVNTASAAGLVATPGLGVYNTSKYAVVGLSETLARELKPHGLGVSVLCPLGVATRIRESERTRPPELRNDTTAADAGPVSLMGRTLAPDRVAAMAIEAIRDNRLYVITHPEVREALRRRCQRLEQAVPAG